MERLPQLLGTDAQPRNPAFVEKCRQCRGLLVQAGEEVACTNCGAVARKEDLPAETVATSRRASTDRHLGSYMGTRADEGSVANFNENSTVGYVKRVSDHMGEDSSVWNCTAMIERVAEKLSLPVFVRQNAVLLSERMLADRKNDEGPKGGKRATVPAISAYCLLSACRDARIDHVSSQSILQALADMGHRVTKSKLLRLGIESQVRIRPADPLSLLQTVLSRLETNEEIVWRLRNKGVEPPQFFRGAMETAKIIVALVREDRGCNPRTLAAGAVYLASKAAGKRLITQKEVADTLGIAEYTVREFAGWAASALNAGEP